MVSTRWGNIEMGDCVAICVNRNESFRWGTYFTAKYANSGVQLCEIVAQKKKKEKKNISQRRNRVFPTSIGGNRYK